MFESLALVIDLARRAAARLIIKAIEALFGKPLSPGPTVSRETPSVADRAIVHAIGGQQHDLGSHRIDPSNLSPTRAHFQLAALAVREDDLHRWTARHLHLRIKKTGRGNHDPMVMPRNF
ncbi:MAG: hypothetical protein WA624_14010 [Methylocella sp.]